MTGPAPLLVALALRGRPLAWPVLLGLLLGLLVVLALPATGVATHVVDGLGSWRWSPALMAALA
jgi:hypothetical protein